MLWTSTCECWRGLVRLIGRTVLSSASARFLHSSTWGQNGGDVALPPPRTFDEAVAASRALTGLPAAARLRLYALYKQATVGDAPPELADYLRERGPLDAAATYKYRSWELLRGMSTADARAEYVQTVAAGGRDAGAADAADGEMGDADEFEEAMAEGFAGAVMSSMAVNEEDERALAEADEAMPLHGAARNGDGLMCAQVQGGRLLASLARPHVGEALVVLPRGDGRLHEPAVRPLALL